jgi:hypothetical protein
MVGYKVSMVKPKWILQGCPKWVLRTLHVTLERRDTKLLACFWVHHTMAVLP